MGTDYFSYLEMFRTGNLDYLVDKRGEIVFTGAVEFFRAIGISGQGIFFAFSLICVLILIYAMKDAVSNRYLWIYFFVFICVCGTFHNQMNGLRQYVAIYVTTLIVREILHNRYAMASALTLVAGLIHMSFFLFVPILLIVFLFKDCDKRWFLYSVLLTGIVFSVILTDRFMSNIISLFGSYSYYWEKGMIGEASFINRITKYIYIPLIFLAIYRLPRMNLTRLQRRYFTIGVFGFAAKISLMSISLIYRAGLYLEVLSCLPIIYLMIYCKGKGKVMEYVLMIGYILLPYAIKVLVSKSGEYSYDFFLFHHV